MHAEAQKFILCQELLSTSEAAHKMSVGRYTAGVGSINELLHSQEALVVANDEYHSSLAKWRLARMKLATSSEIWMLGDF